MFAAGELWKIFPRFTEGVCLEQSKSVCLQYLAKNAIKRYNGEKKSLKPHTRTPKTISLFVATCVCSDWQFSTEL